MKRVLTAIILIPIVVLALFRAPLWLFALLVLGVALLAAREYLNIAAANGLRPFRRLSYLFLICIFLLSYAASDVARNIYYVRVSLPLEIVGAIALLLVAGSPFILLVAGMTRDPLSQSLPDAASSFLLLPYVGVSLASMVIVRADSNGALFLLFLMLLVWSGDIAAYYTGRAIGRHKLSPRVSPGKSWEGAIASAIGAVLVAVLLFHNLRPVYFALKGLHLFPAAMTPDLFALPRVTAPVAAVIALALSVNIAAQFGDLVESMMKRGGGVKDSGTLLPGHGGVLDRIDALLFAVPVGWFFYFALLAPYFHGTP